MSFLSEELQRRTSLKQLSLNLSGVDVTDVGMNTLGQALQKLISLDKLSLDFTR